MDSFHVADIVTCCFHGGDFGDGGYGDGEHDGIHIGYGSPTNDDTSDADDILQPTTPFLIPGLIVCNLCYP